MVNFDSEMIHAVKIWNHTMCDTGENFQNTNFIKNGRKKRSKSTFTGNIHSKMVNSKR